jgi:hypothetical protein
MSKRVGSVLMTSGSSILFCLITNRETQDQISLFDIYAKFSMDNTS